MTVSLEEFLAKQPAQLRKQPPEAVHGYVPCYITDVGPVQDARYKLTKVRFAARYWVRVWAILLPPVELPEQITAKGHRIKARLLPWRYFCLPCQLFPKGGWWPAGQAYHL